MDNIGYVYDRFGMFWNDSYTPEQLKKLDDLNHSDIGYIRRNLYSKKIHSDEYKLIFVNSEKPYFRRWNISEAERNGFSSVCESKLHKACKLGIARAKCIRVKIDGKDYLLRKKWTETETTYQLMGNKYETDCEYAIADISDDLASILNGEVIFFEVHHKSRVKPKKMMAYKMTGLNILEFDILTKYLPSAIINESCDEEKMIQFFSDYYEDIEKHYISGTYYAPIVSDIVWNGGIGNVYDIANNKEIEIKIYKDHFSKKKML
ncbi:hypothetical protein SAMN05660484_00904 [Eubacterium ruminantium]|uniref:Uncharacterized protein n=1 Tax=Eubacterium ruminantium TaxID=42322 RepID=A0A1T4KZM0_9FIRM|nr:hypothetical protein [Eubacterium ruminantium]SCW42230.1 hypothetical protein SAMN05660484_00904 [Eubacterium ruminantium]SDN20131.1 hypothetical protein SAMN04490370_1136 [Eubacterium ruminantium]SJZ47757.1 hypothetical protein SAMN02745110_00584 [Eubacterium ruminantium]